MTAIDTFIAAEDFTAMMLGKANRGHAGLGFQPPGIPFQDALSRRASRFIAEKECAERLEEVFLLPTYRDLWSAIQADMVQDRHWQRALLGLSDKLLSFALKAATNCLPTNSNLAMWRKMGPSTCPLCGMLQSPGHVFNCCIPALNEGRYTFRHDLVLGVFISACASANPGLAFHYNLDYLADSRKYIFPFPVLDPLRPDVTVTSQDGSSIWLVELTVPLPHRVSDSNFSKGQKYRKLALDVAAATGATVDVLPFEVTSYGNVARSTRHTLLALGLSSSQARLAMVSLAQAAILGSYTVFKHRNAPAMPRQPLADLFPPLPCPSVNPIRRARASSTVGGIAFIRGIDAALPVEDNNCCVFLPDTEEVEELPHPAPSPENAIGSGATPIPTLLLPPQRKNLSQTSTKHNNPTGEERVEEEVDHLLWGDWPADTCRDQELGPPNLASEKGTTDLAEKNAPPPQGLQAEKGWEKIADPEGGPSFFRCLRCGERRDNAVSAGQHARRCRERQQLLPHKRPKDRLPSAVAAGRPNGKRCSQHQRPSSELPGMGEPSSRSPCPAVAHTCSGQEPDVPLPHPALRSGKGWMEVVDANGDTFFRCLLCSERSPNPASAGQHARRCREKFQAPARPPK